MGTVAPALPHPQEIKKKKYSFVKAEEYKFDLD